MNSGFIKGDVLRFGTPARQVPAAPDPDSIELRGLARLFLNRWKTILGVTLLTAAAVFFLVSLLPPSYTARAEVIIDPRRAQIVTGAEVLRTLEPSQQIINGEISILNSNLLIEDVIRTMGFDALAPIDPSPAATPEVQRIEGLVWAIRQNLQVFAESESYVIVIEFSSGDPALAADLTNTLTSRYLDLQVEGRRETIGQAAGWLEERLDALQAEVELNEETLSQMRTDSLLENGGTLENASQQITTLNNQLVSARAERVTAEARMNQLTNLLESGGIEDASAVVSSPAIELLRARLRELRQQDAIWAETVGPDHPRRAPIQNDIAQVRDEIAAEVRNVLEVQRGEYEVADMREQSLEETIVQMEERVVDISRAEIGLRQLEREATATRQTYDALLSRLTEARTQERLQKAEATLIERATLPSGPTAPRPKLMGALGGAVAFALVTLVVFLGDMTATTFRNEREVTAETGLPVLAALPSGRWSSLRRGMAKLRKDAFAPFAERIRQLRTTLLTRDESILSPVIVVLSAVPGEGKTTTALALADMSVRAGKSTILVDCDMRRASLQRGFGWRMPHDLADVLTGRCALEDAIFAPNDVSFDVLAMAKPDPDAAEELSTVWLRPVLEQLKDIYDVVILEAPALLAVSDAMIISQAADKRVLVVECERTERGAVRDALGMLDEMNLSVEGIVLNKVPARKNRSYRYG